MKITKPNINVFYVILIPLLLSLAIWKYLFLNCYGIYAIHATVAEPISMSTPQMNYVNENSQNNRKEHRRGNNNNK